MGPAMRDHRAAILLGKASPHRLATALRASAAAGTEDEVIEVGSAAMGNVHECVCAWGRVGQGRGCICPDRVLAPNMCTHPHRYGMKDP